MAIETVNVRAGIEPRLSDSRPCSKLLACYTTRSFTYSFVYPFICSVISEGILSLSKCETLIHTGEGSSLASVLMGPTLYLLGPMGDSASLRSLAAHVLRRRESAGGQDLGSSFLTQSFHATRVSLHKLGFGLCFIFMFPCRVLFFLSKAGC